jgi:hypothetical protein
MRNLVQLRAVPPALRADDGGPDDTCRARRLEWSKLLKRVFAVDVLSCPRCDGPMRMVAFVADERIARKILTHLGLASRPPPRSTRRPRHQQLELADADPEPNYDGLDSPLLVD